MVVIMHAFAYMKNCVVGYTYEHLNISTNMSSTISVHMHLLSLHQYSHHEAICVLIKEISSCQDRKGDILSTPPSLSETEQSIPYLGKHLRTGAVKPIREECLARGQDVLTIPLYFHSAR